MMDVDHIIMHFDQIFGVHDDTKGLLSFGPTAACNRAQVVTFLYRAVMGI